MGLFKTYRNKTAYVVFNVKRLNYFFKLVLQYLCILM